MAAMLYPVVKQSVWREADNRPVLTWREIGIITGILLVVDLGVLTESPVILYPVAFMSVLGVMFLLVMVFSIVWVLLMGQENGFERIQQLWLPTAAGLTMALLMISVIDLLRLKLTGTWGGFPLG